MQTNPNPPAPPVQIPDHAAPPPPAAPVAPGFTRDAAGKVTYVGEVAAPAPSAPVKPAPVQTQKPSLGRIVLYRLTALDVEAIHRQRGSRPSRQPDPIPPPGLYFDRAHNTFTDVPQPPSVPPPIVPGTSYNESFAGDLAPMLIVGVSEKADKSVTADGHVFLNGPDGLWVKGVSETDDERAGFYTWPVKA